MKKPLELFSGKALLFALLLVIGPGITMLRGREKKQITYATGPTAKLFELLDNSYDGKLADFYVVADTFQDPNNPQQKLTHILRVDYDKTKIFGKLTIHVRSVDKLDPSQEKTYTPEQIYKFGQYDAEKFVKTSPGAPFGQPGDLFLQSSDNMPLASAPVTEQVRQEYDDFLNQYVIPALQKKQVQTAAGTSGGK